MGTEAHEASPRLRNTTGPVAAEVELGQMFPPGMRKQPRRATAALADLWAGGLTWPVRQAQLVAALTITVITCGQALGQGGEPIEAIARRLFEAGKFHGGLLVAEGEETIYRGAFGFADRERGIPNSPDTHFPIFSITKPFTAVLVLQLVEEESLQLDETVWQYLPSFPSEAADRITIHHLLCHASGLPDYLLTIPEWLQCEPIELTRDEALDVVLSMPL